MEEVLVTFDYGSLELSDASSEVVICPPGGELLWFLPPTTTVEPTEPPLVAMEGQVSAGGGLWSGEKSATAAATTSRREVTFSPNRRPVSSPHLALEAFPGIPMKLVPSSLDVSPRKSRFRSSRRRSISSPDPFPGIPLKYASWTAPSGCDAPFPGVRFRGSLGEGSPPRFLEKDQGASPLLLAASQAGDRAAIESLIHDGESVNARDDRRLTPLLWCVKNDHLHCVPLLLAAGAQVNAQDRHGWTALHFAVEAGGSTLACQQLMAARARIDVQNSYGDTPLHYAVEDGLLDVTRLLVKARANLDATNRQGRTPLDTAIKWGKRACVMALLSGGARYNILAIPPEWSDMLRVVNCKSAIGALCRVLRQHRRLASKDIVILISNLVWRTRQHPLWDAKRTKPKASKIFFRG